MERLRMDLKGKTVLITGAARRIGRALAEAFAREGCAVAVHYLHSADEANELCAALAEHGTRACAFQADLATQAACAGLLDHAVETLGPIDILVNSAAVFERDVVATLDEETVRAQFDVNLLAPMWLTSAFAAQGRGGAIINILDRRIEGFDTAHVSYVLSKKALADFTRLSALALAPAIRVNAVAPGAILPPPGTTQADLRERAGPIPLERACTPMDVADAVCFAARSDAITGQILYVDGGQHLLGTGVDQP